MSLTQFIRIPEVRTALRTACPKPRLALRGDLVAPPRTSHFGLVGTAFDYAFRWAVERASPGRTEASRWLAETVAAHLPSRSGLGREARRAVRSARLGSAEYIAGGPIVRELLADALRIAHLDTIYRSGVVWVGPEDIRTPDPSDVDDLAALVDAIPLDLFSATHCCRLNPHYGDASKMVGGADADLRIDDRLVDVKATKFLALREDDFHQLLGYTILERLDPPWGTWDGKPIAKVEIYFARHGKLVSLPLESLVASRTLDALGQMFSRVASVYVRAPQVRVKSPRHSRGPTCAEHAAAKALG